MGKGKSGKREVSKVAGPAYINLVLLYKERFSLIYEMKNLRDFWGEKGHLFSNNHSGYSIENRLSERQVVAGDQLKGYYNNQVGETCGLVWDINCAASEKWLDFVIL